MKESLRPVKRLSAALLTALFAVLVTIHVWLGTPPYDGALSGAWVGLIVMGMVWAWLRDWPAPRIIMAFIVAGFLLGILAGFVMAGEGGRFAWLGDLFLRALQMVIVPLIVASLVVAVSRVGELRKLGRVGGVTFLYYVFTTGVSVTIGLVVVNLLQPGVPGIIGGTLPESIAEAPAFSLIDVVRSMIPSNLISAAARGEILPLIVFSILFGVVLSTMEESADVVVQFFDGVNQAMMKLVELIMWYAPIGVFGLIAGILAEAGGGWQFLAEARKIGWFCVTVVVGLTLHGGIVLPAVLGIVALRNPLPYVRNMGEAFFTALSTDSSSATLPVTLECVIQKNRVDPSAADLVLPLGATVNMDGTALYEATAALFIAQSAGIELTLVQQTIVFLTATLAAVGAAGIPHAGLVTMVMVLQSVGLPLEGIATLLAVDWFLDRCRTSVNVFGDAVGAAVVERFGTQAASGIRPQESGSSFSAAPTGGNERS